MNFEYLPYKLDFKTEAAFYKILYMCRNNDLIYGLELPREKSN
jgi:hypothetical protein